jgi:hypothetical protein
LRSEIECGLSTYSLPHLHVASSLRWNRCKYAFVIPCPVSTDVISGVSFILDLSLAWTVGKYCLVAAAFWLVHSAIFAWLLLWLLGILYFLESWRTHALCLHFMSLLSLVYQLSRCHVFQHGP